MAKTSLAKSKIASIGNQGKLDPLVELPGGKIVNPTDQTSECNTFPTCRLCSRLN